MNTNIDLSNDLNVVPFISVDHMMRLVNSIGLENVRKVLPIISSLTLADGNSSTKPPESLRTRKKA